MSRTWALPDRNGVPGSLSCRHPNPSLQVSFATFPHHWAGRHNAGSRTKQQPPHSHTSMWGKKRNCPLQSTLTRYSDTLSSSASGPEGKFYITACPTTKRFVIF